MMKSKMSIPMQSRVLAVDPGFDRVGLAVLEKENSKEKLLFSSCIETDRKAPHHIRLDQIGNEVQRVIKKWEPTHLAIENLFFNQNTTNAIKVAEARGVIVYEAARANLEISEYGPQAIKIAVTGYGKADKAQVALMVEKLVKIPNSKAKMLDDELDAIAVGITHLASQNRI